MPNRLDGYTDSLDNKKIQFKQGTQADLNTMIVNGGADEGTFYLTIDTHKLYVGRKKTSDSKVYPEQVSRGVTVVDTAANLPSLNFNNNDPAAPAGAIEEGELFYITDSNILAALRYDSVDQRYEWKQINPPTGISAVTSSIAAESGNTGNVNVQVGVSTTGGSKNTTFQLIAGDNITLTPNAANTAVTITSQNSQSNLGIQESTKSTNKSQAVLSDGTNLDTSIYFVGAQDTGTSASYSYNTSADTSVVSGKTYYTRSGTSPNYTYTAVANPTGNPSTSNYYERENVITILGPEVQGVAATTRGTAGGTGDTHGFELVAKVKPGTSDSVSNKKLSSNGSVVDPVIDYGTNSSAYFYGGHAKLDVYTKSEADTAIENAVTSHLQVADAMIYKGTVDSADKLTSTTATGSVKKDAQIGDTYKAAAAFSLQQDINNVSTTTAIKVGDLLIANGVEYQNTDSNAPGYTTDASLVGKLNPSTMYWDVIPSGNEPVPVGEVLASNSTPYFRIKDANNNPNTTILKVSFDNANSTLVKAVGVGSNATDYKIQLTHDAESRSDTIANLTAATASDSDSIGSSGIKIFALKDTITSGTADAIQTDGYGHISSIKGNAITLKHNYLTTFTASHTASYANNLYTGTIQIGGTNSITGLNSTAASAVIKSETLAITANGANTQLNVDLVWGSF